MTFPFVLPLQLLSTLTDNVVKVIDHGTPEDTEVLVICPRSQKVIVSVYQTPDAITVLPRRVNGQHTMNCLSMQAIDISEPFNDVTILSKDIDKKAADIFEDHLQSTYYAHQKLSQSGYRLWRSDLLMQANCVKLRNIYVLLSELNLEQAGEQDIASITMEAHITTADLRDVFETSRDSRYYWRVTISSDAARLSMAVRFSPHTNYTKDIVIEAKPAMTSNSNRAIDTTLSIAVMDAFDIKCVTGKHQTSRPGSINTIGIFRCVDNLDNVFNLSITYNDR